MQITLNVLWTEAYVDVVQPICFNMQITTLYLCCSTKRRAEGDNYHKLAVLYQCRFSHLFIVFFFVNRNEPFADFH